MKLRPVLMPALVLTAGVALLAWLFLADPPAPPDAAKVTAAGNKHSVPSLQPSENTAGSEPEAKNRPATSKTPLPSEIRDVSPEGISPPQVTDTLTRIEPSQPYLDLLNPPVEPVPDGRFELRRPQVIDAGTLKTDDLVVRIAHINALKADETCVSRVGGTWPCGARARTALRGLVRMFTLTCEKTEDLGPRQIAATCVRRKTDIGEWLVRYGWADPAENAPDPYAALAEEAQKKKSGKWQAEWLKELPEPSVDLSAPKLSSELFSDDNNILVDPQDLPLPNEDLRETLPPNG